MSVEEQNQTVELPEGYSWVPRKGHNIDPGFNLMNPTGKQIGTATINFTNRKKWSFSNHKHPIGIGNFESIDEAREALVKDMFENI